MDDGQRERLVKSLLQHGDQIGLDRKRWGDFLGMFIVGPPHGSRFEQIQRMVDRIVVQHQKSLEITNSDIAVLTQLGILWEVKYVQQ